MIDICARSAASSQAVFDERFSGLPDHLRIDPYRAALLPVELTRRLLSFQLPAPAEYFLALGEGGEVVGRIGTNVSPVYAGLAYVGFFEVDVSRDDAPRIAARLLDEAARWARAQGRSRLVGPVDLTTWFNYRLAVVRAPTLPSSRFFSWEPVNPPQYPDYFTEFGMSELQSYHSQGFSAATADGYLPGYQNLKRAHRSAEAQGFKIRSFDSANFESRELALLHRISHRVLADAFLFEPLPFEMFAGIYAAALQKFDSSPSRIVEAPDGTCVGFLFAFFDADHVVIKTVAVLPEYQNMKLSLALLCPAAEMAQARGIGRGVSALVRDGIKVEYHEKQVGEEAGGASWRHDYVLFGKDL